MPCASHILPIAQDEELKSTRCLGLSGNFGCQHKIPTRVCQAIILTALAGQNTIGILLNSHALQAGKESESGAPFNPQAGAILQDFIKILPSFAIAVALGERPSAVLESRFEVLRSGVPGFCYLLMNTLTFVAVSNIGPGEYAVTQKLRVLFVALFSYWGLGKNVGCRRWFALVSLCFGVFLVHASMKLHSDDAGPPSQANLGVGVSATLGASFLSAVAGVYCEKILKESSTSLWIRNVHFSVYGCLMGIIGLFATGNAEQVMTDGIFAGCSTLVIWAIVCNSIGGILVSLAIKYVDVIASNLSQIVALVLITSFSVLWQNHNADWLFLLGVGVVCSSVVFYSLDMPLSYVFVCVACPKLPDRVSKHPIILSVGIAAGCFVTFNILFTGLVVDGSFWDADLAGSVVDQPSV